MKQSIVEHLRCTLHWAASAATQNSNDRDAVQATQSALMDAPDDGFRGPADAAAAQRAADLPTANCAASVAADTAAAAVTVAMAAKLQASVPPGSEQAADVCSAPEQPVLPSKRGCGLVVVRADCQSSLTAVPAKTLLHTTLLAVPHITKVCGALCYALGCGACYRKVDEDGSLFMTRSLRGCHKKFAAYR